MIGVSDEQGPRLIGYWREVLPAAYPGMKEEQREAWEERRSAGRRWPDPGVFVDRHWAGEEQAAAAHHLEVGTLVNQYRGISSCRFCGRHNGSAELTDGTYCWPEGLAHYVREHGIRLPQIFLAHVTSSFEQRQKLSSPNFNQFGQRDRAWPGADQLDLLWSPQEASSEWGLDIEVDATWWLQQGQPFTGRGV